MKWFMLLCVVVVLMLSCGSFALVSIYGPVVFTNWRNAIRPVQENPDPVVAPPQGATQDPVIAPPVQAPQAVSNSLNYDESNGDALSPGQSQLIATYLRLESPISQSQLESAVSAIQIEAASVKAETHEGSSLTLNQSVAWLVWCSDATLVDPPADFSLPIEESFLSAETLGRVYIQVPFDLNVPPRTDASWTGCESFWAAQVH